MPRADSTTRKPSSSPYCRNGYYRIPPISVPIPSSTSRVATSTPAEVRHSPTKPRTPLGKVETLASSLLDPLSPTSSEPRPPLVPFHSDNKGFKARKLPKGHFFGVVCDGDEFEPLLAPELERKYSNMLTWGQIAMEVADKEATIREAKRVEYLAGVEKTIAGVKRCRDWEEREERRDRSCESEKKEERRIKRSKLVFDTIPELRKSPEKGRSIKKALAKQQGRASRKWVAYKGVDGKEGIVWVRADRDGVVELYDKLVRDGILSRIRRSEEVRSLKGAMKKTQRVLAKCNTEYAALLPNAAKHLVYRDVVKPIGRGLFSYLIDKPIFGPMRWAQRVAEKRRKAAERRREHLKRKAAEKAFWGATWRKPTARMARRDRDAKLKSFGQKVSSGLKAGAHAALAIAGNIACAGVLAVVYGGCVTVDTISLGIEIACAKTDEVFETIYGMGESSNEVLAKMVEPVRRELACAARREGDAFVELVRPSLLRYGAACEPYVIAADRLRDDLCELAGYASQQLAHHGPIVRRRAEELAQQAKDAIRPASWDMTPARLDEHSIPAVRRMADGRWKRYEAGEVEAARKRGDLEPQLYTINADHWALKHEHGGRYLVAFTLTRELEVHPDVRREVLLKVRQYRESWDAAFSDWFESDLTWE